MKTKEVNRVASPALKVPFNVQDEKGREMGCVVYSGEVDFIEAPADTIYAYAVAPGHYFTATVQATKDGKKWGASQGGKIFKPREEQDAYIKRRVADSRKAAEKKATK